MDFAQYFAIVYPHQIIIENYCMLSNSASKFTEIYMSGAYLPTSHQSLNIFVHIECHQLCNPGMHSHIIRIYLFENFVYHFSPFALPSDANILSEKPILMFLPIYLLYKTHSTTAGSLNRSHQLPTHLS